MRNATGNVPDDGGIVGTSAYYQSGTAYDPVIQPQPEPYPQTGFGDRESDAPGWTPTLKRPRPDTGGFLEAFGRLGYSLGLGAFRMATRMRGQAIERIPVILEGNDGPVGFGTRSTFRPKFLFTDYTPNDEEIAKSALQGWRE